MPCEETCSKFCCCCLNTEDEIKNSYRRKCCFCWSVLWWIIGGSLSLFGVVLFRFSTSTGGCTFIRSKPPFITVAHRGWVDAWQENTVQALLDAARNGSNPEFDVMLTKDERLVVFHDFNMKRLTGVDKFVYDVTYAEIQAMNILSTIDGYAFNQTAKIPLFSEVITALCAYDSGMSMMIDMKFSAVISPTKRDRNMNSKLIQQLKASNCSGGTLLMQNHPYYLRKFVQDVKDIGRFTVYGGVIMAPQVKLGLSYSLLQSKLWIAAGKADYVGAQYYTYLQYKPELETYQKEGWCTGIYGNKNLTSGMLKQGANVLYLDLPGKFVYKGEGYYPDGWTAADAQRDKTLYTMFVFLFIFVWFLFAILSCFGMYSICISCSQSILICEACGKCETEEKTEHLSNRIQMSTAVTV